MNFCFRDLFKAIYILDSSKNLFVSIHRCFLLAKQASHSSAARLLSYDKHPSCLSATSKSDQEHILWTVFPGDRFDNYLFLRHLVAPLCFQFIFSAYCSKRLTLTLHIHLTRKLATPTFLDPFLMRASPHPFSVQTSYSHFHAHFFTLCLPSNALQTPFSQTLVKLRLITQPIFTATLSPHPQY